jgi:glycosyltransferase involved in cell wall biosynthesis
MSSVSVVMAVYNGQRFLLEQVASVLGELLPGDELIVVDDASPDGSLAILKSIDSPVLRVYTNPSNLGVIGSFERGLQFAAHEFIFLCDQDDVWLSGKRAAFVAAFEQDPTVSVVISDAQMIDAQGRLIAPSFMTTRHGFDGSVFATVWRNRYLGCTMAMRHSLLAIALPVPRQVPMHDMWFGIMGRMTGKVVYLPTPFLQYRRHTGNVSPSCRQSLPRMFRWRIALLAALCSRILLRMLGFHGRPTGASTKSSDREEVRK